MVGNDKKSELTECQFNDKLATHISVSAAVRVEVNGCWGLSIVDWFNLPFVVITTVPVGLLLPYIPWLHAKAA